MVMDSPSHSSISSPVLSDSTTDLTTGGVGVAMLSGIQDGGALAHPMAGGKFCSDGALFIASILSSHFAESYWPLYSLQRPAISGRIWFTS